MTGDTTDFFYIARVAKHAERMPRTDGPDVARAAACSPGRKPTWPPCEGAGELVNGSYLSTPLHSSPVSIITARDDDNCTEIQSDLQGDGDGPTCEREHILTLPIRTQTQRTPQGR